MLPDRVIDTVEFLHLKVNRLDPFPEDEAYIGRRKEPQLVGNVLQRFCLF